MKELSPAPRLRIDVERSALAPKNLFAHLVNGIIVLEEFRRKPVEPYVSSERTNARRQRLDQRVAEQDKYHKLQLHALTDPEGLDVPLQTFLRERHVARAEALGSYILALGEGKPRFAGIKRFKAKTQQSYHNWRTNRAEDRIVKLHERSK